MAANTSAMSGGRCSFLVELDLSLGVLGENQLVSVPSAPREMVLAARLKPGNTATAGSAVSFPSASTRYTAKPMQRSSLCPKLQATVMTSLLAKATAFCMGALLSPAETPRRAARDSAAIVRQTP